MVIANLAPASVDSHGRQGANMAIVTPAPPRPLRREAWHCIRRNDADVMVAGGTESTITPLSWAGSTPCGPLDANEEPERASALRQGSRRLRDG